LCDLTVQHVMEYSGVLPLQSVNTC